ncbi:class IIb bacteriocin, lactobin A/cerein 7B family [Arsenicibacter rosenii]
MDSIELTEEELEAISGGVTPACFYVGMVIGVAFWAAIS